MKTLRVYKTYNSCSKVWFLPLPTLYQQFLTRGLWSIYLISFIIVTVVTIVTTTSIY